MKTKITQKNILTDGTVYNRFYDEPFHYKELKDWLMRSFPNVFTETKTPSNTLNYQLRHDDVIKNFYNSHGAGFYSFKK